jgi:apolipoprotein D and lipocalin family protein
MKRLAILGLALSLTYMAVAQKSMDKNMNMDKPKTAEDVDVPHYLGKWYEIARFDNRFEKDLVGVTATYSQTKSPSKIKVHNEGYKYALNGKHKSSTGHAKVVGEGKLKVTFFWPFYAPYWILDVDKVNYSYSLVGTPDRQYLWILSRLPKLDSKIYDSLVATAKAQGYDVSKLMKIEQPDEATVKPPVKKKGKR